MSEKVKLAIVGCGGIAGAHLGGYEKLLHGGYDRFEIAAVCDTNEKNTENFQNRIGEYQDTPVAFGSVDEMLKAGIVDAADICTPHAFHHTTALPILKKGIPVMVEKPCGITVRATKKMMKAAEKGGTFIAAAEQIRRTIGARTIEWAINKKKMIGEPRFFTQEVMGVMNFDWTSYAFAWRGVKLLMGGGMILDAGVHFTDMMLYVFGPVEEVYCITRKDHDITVDAPIIGKSKVDMEDTWLGTLRFASGLVGHWSWSCTGYGHEVKTGTYYGEKGSFCDRQKWMHAFQFGADLKLKNGKEVAYEELQEKYLGQLSQKKKDTLFPFGCDDGISNECWDFIDAVDKGRSPEITAEGALAAKSIALAMYESALTGVPVKPADIESGKKRDFQKPVDEYWKI